MLIRKDNLSFSFCIHLLLIEARKVVSGCDGTGAEGGGGVWADGLLGDFELNALFHHSPRLSNAILFQVCLFFFSLVSRVHLQIQIALPS